MRWHFGRPNGEGRKSLRGAWLGSRRRNKDHGNPSREGRLCGAGRSPMKQGGNWYYYLADGLGSTMAVVNSSGAVQKSYQYDVYGEVTGGSGSLANEFDFAGQQTDGSTGLQYLRARYYDPATGTFLSRDPMAAMPEWAASGYSYGKNDPVGLTDPTGLFPLCVLSGECLDPIFKFFGLGDDDSGGDCYGQPLSSAPCLGPPSASARVGLRLSDFKLVGEYLVLSGVGKFDVRKNRPKPIELEHPDPKKAAFELFEALRKSAGSPAVQYEVKGGRLRLFFKTKDGTVVNYRIGKVGETPSIDLGYPAQQGNIKLKFVQPK